MRHQESATAMNRPSPPVPAARRYSDFEELCEDLRAWSLDLRQLDTGQFAGELLQFAGDRALLSAASFGRRLEQRGLPPQEMWTFGIPRQDSSPFQWRRQAAGPGDLLVFAPGMELDALSTDGFSIYTLSVPEEQLAEVSRELGLPLESLLSRPGLKKGQPGRTRALTHLLEEICQDVRDGVAGSGRRTQLDFQVTTALLQSLSPDSASRSPEPFGSRGQLIERAITFIRASAGEVISVGDICQAVGASHRTLHRAFSECFGVSPKTYLQAFRLNGVRKLLSRELPSSATIGSVANRWGFWHMGQFAADYRRMFHELPSETMSRRRDRRSGDPSSQ